MTHSELVEQVRHLVRATVTELSGAPLASLAETILVRQGCYCGRRFTSPRIQAVWFIEEDQVKFYSADGGVVRVCRPSQWAVADTRRAA